MTETPATRTRITATPLYAGSFFPEDGRPVEIPDATPATALSAVEDDGSWFCLEIRTAQQKRWTDGADGEMWTTEGTPSSYRIYVGESLTAADLEQRPDADSYAILLSNMRGNGWERVVQTRRGNFQPIDTQDVVVGTVDAGAARRPPRPAPTSCVPRDGFVGTA